MAGVVTPPWAVIVPDVLQTVRAIVELQNDGAALSPHILGGRVGDLVADGRLHDLAKTFAEGVKRGGAVREVEAGAGLFRILCGRQSAHGKKRGQNLDRGLHAGPRGSGAFAPDHGGPKISHPKLRQQGHLHVASREGRSRDHRQH